MRRRVISSLVWTDPDFCWKSRALGRRMHAPRRKRTEVTRRRKTVAYVYISKGALIAYRFSIHRFDTTTGRVSHKNPLRDWCLGWKQGETIATSSGFNPSLKRAFMCVQPYTNKDKIFCKPKWPGFPTQTAELTIPYQHMWKTLRPTKVQATQSKRV